jgi:hypothetical protein
MKLVSENNPKHVDSMNFVVMASNLIQHEAVK